MNEPLQIPQIIAEMSHERALYEAAALAMLKKMVRCGAGNSVIFLLKNDEALHGALMTYLTDKPGWEEHEKNCAQCRGDE
jgi:hypothetical protein